MKKFLVVGNPIDHSLSPKLHNYWIKKNNIDAKYEKKLTVKSDLQNIIIMLRKNEINGLNITVPFKKEVINFLDDLSPEARETESVNTILKENNKIVGHNTDIAGFELAIRHVNYNLKDKNILIIGAGGVVPSIIYAIKKTNKKKISIMNRTIANANVLKKKFDNLEVLKWGSLNSFDMIINATSLGLKEKDKINLNFDDFGENKFFFDVIYNPEETNFLKNAKKNNHKIENGKMMFIYQAHQAFTLWHKVMPKIDNNVIKLFDNE